MEARASADDRPEKPDAWAQMADSANALATRDEGQPVVIESREGTE